MTSSADADDDREVALDDASASVIALERQRDQQERDRQAGGVEGEQQRAVGGGAARSPPG